MIREMQFDSSSRDEIGTPTRSEKMIEMQVNRVQLIVTGDDGGCGDAYACTCTVAAYLRNDVLYAHIYISGTRVRTLRTRITQATRLSTRRQERTFF